ncbi:MAG: CinA family protein [Bifidobacterium sp.]|nr:CinA family protein [Bifidobacterium sp.]
MHDDDITRADPRTLATVPELRRYCDAQAAAILDWCAERGVRIACAESLTGGLLADAFVRVPGASRVFLGSAVTYDIRAKASVLGVDRKLLRERGAVDPEVAIQMAQLTAKLFSQPEYRSGIIGLSTTGVAGPGPDGDKPAGLVYIGVSLPKGNAGPGESSHYAVQLELQGSRDVIRHRTVGCVMENLREFTGSSQE